MSVRWGLCLLLAVLVLLPLPADAVEIGEAAPDFITADVNGGPYIVLSDYRGDVVCLVFFWTG
jgi:hypothetical protein